MRIPSLAILDYEVEPSQLSSALADYPRVTSIKKYEKSEMSLFVDIQVKILDMQSTKYSCILF